MGLNFTGIFIPALVSGLFRSRLESFPAPPQMLDEYDYIIVGSGPGGSIVANRLSQDPNINVLLLEAGTKDNVTTQLPFCPLALVAGGYDWNYLTTPQTRSCLAMYDKQCNIPAGKAIGGSTVLDLTIHGRGTADDYKRWEEQGNLGWSYDDVLPFFKQYEDFRVGGDCVEDEVHGCGGELTISGLGNETEIEETKYFIHGLKEIGYKELDYRGIAGIGISRGQYRIKDGIRQTAATSFLRPIIQRANLHIFMECFVRKILIDPETKSAFGVEFEKEGTVKNVKAKREVILSAGTYSSPKILMLSGIGPKETLEKFNIPVISDVPGVGQNLQDFLSTLVMFSTGTPPTPEQEDFITPTNIRKWYRGKGIFASPNGIDAFAWLKSSFSDRDEKSPDLVLMMQSVAFQSYMSIFLKKAGNVRDEPWDEVTKDVVDKNTLNIQPILLHPKSRGMVTLRSTNPHDYPIIDPNYYSDETDRKILVEGIQFARKIIDTSMFRENGYKYAKTNFSECSHYPDSSDEYFVCSLYYGTLIKWCGCCTNKMGPDTDDMAVVDSQLRVRGVKRLRVVDASVMPEHVSSAPIGTILMIGEKAAAMIKEANQT